MITVSKAALELGRLELLGEVGVLRAGAGSGAQQGDAPTEQRIVGCGYPGHGEDVQLLIVNSNVVEPLELEGDAAVGAKGAPAAEAWAALPEGQVGEIWVASPSKAQGYWNQSALSQHEFHAPLPANATATSPAAQDGFLRTGDLGFLHAGELFICGRVKDLIIVRGRNHYPQDIERTAELHQAAHLRAGCSAAFSLVATKERHTEEVIYVAEVVSFCSGMGFLWFYLNNMTWLLHFCNLTAERSGAGHQVRGDRARGEGRGVRQPRPGLDLRVPAEDAQRA